MTPSETVSSATGTFHSSAAVLQQHHARDRAAAADIVLRAADAAAAAGRHVAPDALAGEVLVGGDQFGRRPCFQSHSSSSATSWARPVSVPWPISERAIADHAAVVGLDQHPGIDLVFCRRLAPSTGPGPNGRLNPSASPPPAAAEPTMNLRRESFAALPRIVSFSWCFSLDPQSVRRWRPCARPPGCADRFRTGRCWSSPRRCPCRSASGSS